MMLAIFSIHNRRQQQSEILKTKMKNPLKLQISDLLRLFLRYLCKLPLMLLIPSALLTYCVVQMVLEDEWHNQTEFSTGLNCSKLLGSRVDSDNSDCIRQSFWLVETLSHPFSLRQTLPP